MTQPGIEPRSPGLLANILLIQIIITVEKHYSLNLVWPLGETW